MRRWKQTTGINEQAAGPGDPSQELLSLENVTVQYGDLKVLDSVSFALSEGEWLMIVGPNGAGKSTIVNTISGEAPYTGQIRFRQQDIRAYKPGELARCIGILSQNHFVGYSFTVREVVGLGRYAYKKGILGGTDEQKEILVDRALEMTGLTELQDHSVLQLSGGELQRTFLAQLFAQDPQVLILDEPTNHLDLIYQKQIFALVREWLQTEGRAVISVVHDLSLAKAYGSSGLLLQKGRLVARGGIDDVFAPEALEAAYSMDVYAWMQEMLGQWT
ncbi:MAG: ABC transporter ATP-binding protein [Blautia sp.]|nr:ABC transporter ATP-binding protein [Blautia sp.]